MKSFSALLLVGVDAAASTNIREVGTCTQLSQNVSEWIVSEFDFHASYTSSISARQNSYEYVSFKLVNPALSYTSRCQVTSNQLQDSFYGGIIYNCTMPMPSSRATFSFSRPMNVLLINQTWSCPGEGSRFSSQGGAKLNLKCHEEKRQDSDWQQGQMHSKDLITCDHINVKVPVKSQQAVA